MWRSPRSDTREVGGICMRASKTRPKVIGSSKKNSFTRNNRNGGGCSSRRIRAPANALVVWALRVERLDSQECRPAFPWAFGALGRGRFSIVCSIPDRVSRCCCVIACFQAQGDGRPHKCASWRPGRCQGCGWRTNFVCLSHRPDAR
jgi:hypothetical protein